jgi:hypothetical protein
VPLLGNYNVLSKGPGQARGGSTVSGDRSNFNKAGAARNVFVNEYWPGYAAIPVGYAPGSAWVHAIKSGYIAARYQASFTFNGAVVLGTAGALAGDTVFTFTAASISYSVGVLEGHITPFTTLSPENLAAAVWNALAAEYNATGSFGEILNAGGSGLTAQQVRDAMKLSPTVGAPAADSIDLDLDKIKALAGLIPATL